MKKESRNKLLTVTIYAIAMGFLEAAVVIYLRKLYYPEGFAFPLKGFIDPAILGVEWIREFATIIMLITIGMLTGKSFYQKFAYFIYSFAIWDIFYYVFLKVTLDWPVSFLTWDILFMIPWPWIGPVIAPLICTALMIAAAFFIIDAEDKGQKVALAAKELIFILLGIFLVLASWLYDYGSLIVMGGFAKTFFTLTENEQFNYIISQYLPEAYNWPLFLLGILSALLGIVQWYKRTNKA